MWSPIVRWFTFFFCIDFVQLHKQLRNRQEEGLFSLWGNTTDAVICCSHVQCESEMEICTFTLLHFLWEVFAYYVYILWLAWLISIKRKNIFNLKCLICVWSHVLIRSKSDIFVFHPNSFFLKKKSLSSLMITIRVKIMYFSSNSFRGCWL